MALAGMICPTCNKEAFCPIWMENPICSDCRNEGKQFSTYTIENAEKIKKNNRNNSLKRKYGISLEEYNELVKQQKGLCTICNTESKLVVDHNHSRQDIHYRGLICNKCNAMIGFANDNPEILEQAIKYIGK